MRLQLTQLGRWFSDRIARTSPRVVPCLLVCALALLRPANVDADAASGTLTGTASLRGNYYWERSTRVVAPAAGLALATPSGVHVDATYLVDAITSASQATGVQSDVPFTEKRHDISAGLGYEFDLGGAQLDLTLRGRFSKEPDYVSRGAGFSAALNLDQRNTVLHFNGYFLHDDVSAIDRMAHADDPDRLIASRPVHKGSFDALSLGLAWDQVLSPTSTLTVGFDAALLEGFQANPYRMVAFRDGGGGSETHPDSRTREAVYGWFAHYFKATRSTLRMGYRFYRDSWDILSHAPEIKLYQELGRYLELRLNYRYYTQSSSFFFRRGGNERTDRYVTADPKMTAFRDQTIGLKLRLSFDFLAFTGLDRLHTAALDFSMAYVFNTNRYGDGVIGQGGFTWPF